MSPMFNIYLCFYYKFDVMKIFSYVEVFSLLQTAFFDTIHENIFLNLEPESRI